MLLDRARILIVTGKGGVGKTTVCAALGLAAARAGQRVLLCETAGSTGVPGLFRRAGKGYEATEVAPNLWTMSITSEAAIEDYVVQQIKFRKLYRMVFRNRVMGPFLDAVPGLHDLIQLGKVFDLERARSGGRPEWDRIIIDAPATGHGLTMLASPRAMMDMTVAGPMHDNARDVAALYEDPTRVSLVLVALPEELPVNETIELYQHLGPMQRQVRAIVLNEVHPAPVPDTAWFLAHREALTRAANAAGREAIHLADDGLRRAALEDEAKARLGALGPPVLPVQFRYRRDLGVGDLASVAVELGEDSP